MSRDFLWQSPAQALGVQGLDAKVLETFLLREQTALEALLKRYDLPIALHTKIARLAENIITDANVPPSFHHTFEHFMREYGLDNLEGLSLMQLAEALLRIPDQDTAEALVREKLHTGNWRAHVGQSQSAWVNAGTKGLLWGQQHTHTESQRSTLIDHLNIKGCTQALRAAMHQMAHTFIAGESVEAALKTRIDGIQSHRFSFDMLGEAALTAQDSDTYWKHYLDAIHALESVSEPAHAKHSLSIKLSALHPRFETLQRSALTELSARLVSLWDAASEAQVDLTLDAEESWQLEAQLSLLTCALQTRSEEPRALLGVAVQAYQKRAPAVIDYLERIAQRYRVRIPVRLVKGAYWDTEVKQAQLLGLSDYPVFVEKAATDWSYICCAQKLLSECPHLVPQFATHNAYSLSAVIHFARQFNVNRIEFQRLHGMGLSLYEALFSQVQLDDMTLSLRTYAPIGKAKEVLPYLVRRILENGANSSFIHQYHDPEKRQALLANPRLHILDQPKRAQRIPLPPDLYQPKRKNALGIALGAEMDTHSLLKACKETLNQHWSQATQLQHAQISRSPSEPHDALGHFDQMRLEQSLTLFEETAGFKRWNGTPVAARAQILRAAAALFEARTPHFVALLAREAGKVVSDAHAELRETVDFCYYYAQQIEQICEHPERCEGPTGEEDILRYLPKGLALCISPWNFPLAIFVGQIVAALAAGNNVVAKPSSLTPVIAHEAIQILYEAGIPAPALRLWCCQSQTAQALIERDQHIDLVCFTGACETARSLQRSLAARSGPIVPLIAETGGLNCMIIDSTALIEQSVRDIVESAFNSAGQRCSALRILCVQTDILSALVDRLCGHLETLKVGSPYDLETDIGPVIDSNAWISLEQHVSQFPSERILFQSTLSPNLKGHYFPPTIIKIRTIEEVGHEAFGPILHVLGFDHTTLDGLLDAIDATQFGLTFGIQSRSERFIARVSQRIRAGNLYINRNMIGATVGVQPFGGRGLSGTGPKAGGPNYLLRFMDEQTLSTNTAAAGGNAALFNQHNDHD